MRLTIIRVAVILFLAFCSNCAISQQFIDLTYPFAANTLHFPAANPFQLKNRFAGYTPAGYFYSVNDFETAEHVGTHLDAPIHFAKGHAAVAQIPLNQLIGKGVKINVGEKTLKDRDYQISIDDILQWEKAQGRIPPQTIVLLYTGYGQYWPNRKNYLGTNKLGMPGVAELRFPGLAPETAKWLVQHRNIKAIGIDTASIDYGQTKIYMSHRILTQNNIPIFENVANLNKIPIKNFFIYALPMKIAQGTGAPLRIIAVIHGVEG